MKAPVGLLSGRAVCVSRWRGVAPTSSAERSKRIFTGGIGNELPQSKPTGFDSSLREGAFGMAALFPAKPQSLWAYPLPLGGAVAQRLRGYKWRSEKSVKAIAPTGAALAFLCFDFFFRIVKGEQPLARCGVGGVQR